MVPEYVLDTSAVRALPEAFLASAHDRARITISPLSVFEILCHLDQPSDKHPSAAEAFAFRKHHVLKCRHLVMRDDPFAEQAQAVGAGSVINPTRFEDRVVVPQLFPLLEQSRTLEEFHQQRVTYPSGESGTVHDVAARARGVLLESEQRYVEFINRLREDLLKRYTHDGTLAMSGGESVRYIAGAAAGLGRHYMEAGAAVAPAAVFSAIFLHVGYLLARTRLYMRRAGEGRALDIDGNDMEDAAILLHLDLTEARALVTNDGAGRREGTIHAFKEAMEHLRAASEEAKTAVAALPEVMSANEFRAAIEPP